MLSNATSREIVPQIFPEAQDEVVFGASGLTIRMARSLTARAAALAFIQGQFRTHFDARVPDDTPLLMVCTNAQGETVAAWGLRTVADGLFSARYLDGNLLEWLDVTIGASPPVDEIVELAHLCVSGPKILPRLVPLLAQALVRMGYHFLVCTATGCLIRYFQKRGLGPVVLATASRDRLPPQDRASWGTYYNHDPIVVGGSIDAALAGGLRTGVQWQ